LSDSQNQDDKGSDDSSAHETSREAEQDASQDTAQNSSQDGPQDAPQNAGAPLLAFDQEPVLAYVEVDRFCTHCGYNLHGRPVRRESNTQLLLANCPECGRLTEANQSTIAAFPWLRRLTTAVLLLWTLFLVLLMLWEAGVQIGIWMTTADEIRWYALYRPEFDHYSEDTITMMIAIFAGSTALSALAVGLITVVAPHWPRWGYYALAIVRPIVIATAITMIWRLAYPDYFELIFPFLIGSLISVLTGGFLGLYCARPLTRLMIRLALPKRFILPLAYLWIIDGKIPPGAKAEKNSKLTDS
jgi:hypothetical protein